MSNSTILLPGSNSHTDESLEFIKSQDSVDFLSKEKRISLGLDFMAPTKMTGNSNAKDSQNQDQNRDSFHFESFDKNNDEFGYSLKFKPQTSITGAADLARSISFKNSGKTSGAVTGTAEISGYPASIISGRQSCLPGLSPSDYIPAQVQQKQDQSILDPIPFSSPLMSEEEEDAFVSRLASFENGLPCLLDLCKESIASAKKTAIFLQKRSAYESEYASNILKSISLQEIPASDDLQQASPFGKSNLKKLLLLGAKKKLNSQVLGGNGWDRQWDSFQKIHQKQGQLHADFALVVNEMAENVNVLIKNTERSRKQLKESAQRYERELLDAESNLDKSRLKYESATEEWEKMNSNTSFTSQPEGFGKMKKSSSLSIVKSFKDRIQKELRMQPKTEEEVRQKVATTNNQYKDAFKVSSNTKTAYYQHHLPRLIRSLKQVNEECRIQVQKNLFQYAQAVEQLMVNEATLISPLESKTATTQEEGLLKVVENVDFQDDMDGFLKEHLKSQCVPNSQSHNSIQTLSLPNNSFCLDMSEIARQSENVGERIKVNPQGQYFGCNLVRIMDMDQDQIPVPRIVTNCIDYIEATGLRQEGLYRVAAPTPLVNRLRSILDVDPGFQLEEVVQDIHVVTSVLKMFFRELEGPLFPREMYADLADATRIDDDRLRLIKIHEQINLLHDAHYATLKCLACHFSRVASCERENKMGIQNIAILWGPTLLESTGIRGVEAEDIRVSSMVLEIIISNVAHIFEI